jgi:hypothetical protein
VKRAEIFDARQHAFFGIQKAVLPVYHVASGHFGPRRDFIRPPGNGRHLPGIEHRRHQQVAVAAERADGRGIERRNLKHRLQF